MNAEARMQTFMKALRDAPPEGQVFLFHGPERYIWRKAIDHLQRHTQRPLQRVIASEATPSSIARIMSSDALFSSPPLLWVDHVEVWKTAQWQAFYPLLRTSKNPVILTSEENLQIPKGFPGETVFFPTLSTRSKTRWLRAELRRRGLSLSAQAFQFLADYVRGARLEQASRVLDLLELYDTNLDLPDLLKILPGVETQIWALGDALMKGDRSEIYRALVDYGQDESVVSMIKHTTLKDLIAYKTGGEIRLQWKKRVYEEWATYFTEKDVLRLWHSLTTTQAIARNQGRFSLAFRHVLLEAMRRTYQQSLSQTFKKTRYT